MHQIIYMSRVTAALSPTALALLLERARQRNEQAGITGALVYGQHQFMQVLEGEQPVIRELYNRILHDARHVAVFKLADKAIAERTFTTWSMAFRELTPGEFKALAGYHSPAEWEQTTALSSSVKAVLLERMRSLLLADAA
jgi:hypothetical protein